MSSSKKQRTRTKILDASWDLIVQEGASVSMSKIASKIGMTRQSIYVHFGSRGGLLMELVIRADERFGIWKSFGAAMQVEDPAKRLDACLVAWFTFVPQIYPVAKDLIALRSRDNDAHEAWSNRMSELVKFYRRLLEGIESAGALSPRWSVQEATDYLWASSSVQAWGLLVHERGWDEASASRVLRATIAAALLKQG